MNSFGRIFRINVFGESHGDCIGVVIDGVPSGISLKESDFLKDLERRKPKGKFNTLRKESDKPIILSGVFKGKTTGAPLCIIIENNDVDSSEYFKLKDWGRVNHGDFTIYKKFKGFNDIRGGGAFSGRITACFVLAGVVSKKIFKNIKISAKLIDEDKIIKKLKEYEKLGIKKSLGGEIECKITGLKVGVGEPIFDSLESLLSHAIFSIPGITAVKFKSGINAGISNGSDIVFKIDVKATPSIGEIAMINLKTGKKKKMDFPGRHDTCFATRVPVIVEALTSAVITDFLLVDRGINA